MKMNRRNVLFALGTTVLLGGMLLGSGAFSQAQAQRTVTVDTVGDGSAAIGLSEGTNYENVTISEDDGEAITIGFEDLNNNATFYFDELLAITNNGGNGAVEVNISTTSSGLSFYNGSTTDDRYENSTEKSLGEIEKGNSESVGFVVETGEFSSEEEVQITISAESQST